MGTSINHYIPYPLDLQNAAVATGNGTEMELNGKHGTLVVQVMGITSATITFEAICSGHKADAYAALIGANRATGAFGSTATANGTYIFDVRGLKKFRARVSTYVSGTIFVHATATAQDPDSAYRSGAATVLAGEKVVTAAATAEAMAGNVVCVSVTVQAKSSNTLSVKLGNATGQYIELLPGASIAIGIGNLNLIYVKVSVNGEGVNYLGVA